MRGAGGERGEIKQGKKKRKKKRKGKRGEGERFVDVDVDLSNQWETYLECERIGRFHFPPFEFIFTGLRSPPSIHPSFIPSFIHGDGRERWTGKTTRPRE